MRVYYNENDKFCVRWLKELIVRGLIPDGDIDERSIIDVRPTELIQYRQVHFFAGIGGWAYALRLAGWPEDREAWTGSCPCQPFSQSGKAEGVCDERHLWPAFRSPIAERLPATIFGEQVASASGRYWLAGVRLDLEALGYAIGGADLCAAGVGAPHPRQRLYWVADSEMSQRRRSGGQAVEGRRSEETGGPGDSGGVGLSNGTGSLSGEQARETSRHRSPIEPAGAEGDRMVNSNDTRPQGRDGQELREHADKQASGSGGSRFWDAAIWHACLDGKQRRIPIEPAFFPLVDGVSPGRVGILRGAGNAIVPELAEQFVRAYMEI